MLYPIISNYINTNKYNKIISSYKITSEEETKKRKKELIDKANKYNKELSKLKVIDIFGNEENDKDNEYNNTLSITGSGIMGYIEIPKIDVRLPIYHGTSESVLSRGVGHLEGTSLPVGGQTTHAVLSAHRGMPSSKLFTDLNQVRERDVFYINVLDEVLAYQVDKISIIEPTDLSEIQLINGEDYVTLMTCTPYGINTHRLLVRGKRIPYKYNKKVAKSDIFSISDVIFYIGLNFVLMMLIIDFILKKKLYLKKDIKIEKLK